VFSSLVVLRYWQSFSVFLTLCFLFIISGCSEAEKPAPSMLEIPVVDVIQRDQPIEVDIVGETKGSSDIPIRARVDGFLVSQDFNEGGNVKKGQLLYTIDPIPYEAKVIEAEGNLAAAKTELVKSKSDLDRYRPLAEINAISKVDLDGAVAKYEAAKGTVQTANAQVDQQKIVLGYTRIYSPIEGRIGISEIQIGEYVGSAAGGGGLLNLVSEVDPIRVRFAIDEQQYLQIASKIITVRKEKGAGWASSHGPKFTLILADGREHKHKGETVGAAVAIDASTGTFSLEADFPNPDHLVLAGQFARVRVEVETRKGALLIPQRSITELQGAFNIFVVDQDGKVQLRIVELGPKIGRLQIVESGVSAGDQVVLEGVQKLKNGMTVVAKPTIFGELPEDPSKIKSDEPQES
jgi:membrane fusion protein, multidrug efflux system